MNCEKCGQAEGKVYKIHYGKKISQKQIDSRTSQTNYDIGGNKEMTLCDKCVLSFRLKKVGTYFAVLVFSALLILAGGSLQRFKEGHLSTLQGIGLIIGCVTALFLLGFGLLISKKEMGELLAIDQSKAELKGKGFDTFWGEEKIKRMGLKH